MDISLLAGIIVVLFVLVLRPLLSFDEWATVAERVYTVPIFVSIIWLLFVWDREILFQHGLWPSVLRISTTITLFGVLPHLVYMEWRTRGRDEEKRTEARARK